MNAHMTLKRGANETKRNSDISFPDLTPINCKRYIGVEIHWYSGAK